MGDLHVCIDSTIILGAWWSKPEKLRKLKINESYLDAHLKPWWKVLKILEGEYYLAKMATLATSWMLLDLKMRLFTITHKRIVLACRLLFKWQGIHWNNV